MLRDLKCPDHAANDIKVLFHAQIGELVRYSTGHNLGCEGRSMERVRLEDLAYGVLCLYEGHSQEVIPRRCSLLAMNNE